MAQQEKNDLAAESLEKELFLIEKAGGTHFGSVVFWECCGVFETLEKALDVALHQIKKAFCIKEISIHDLKEELDETWKATVWRCKNASIRVRKIPAGVFVSPPRIMSA